ncbi:hypothetical protein DFJ58DRAFT_736806 [Suillus subalutaceus]|uniref:uncharacterized protein n=1 Tax=Suillus subalutaceus TaxID=48586 RepID=UPI001B8872DF|nr:uncharacterized protein DFJ58DRAFT_736806 [Suillus subalutaceus]KAG1830952.1 hypothetical protein DFJ58DRAFT_736806 [Suillus subalutaceus]
MALVHQLHLYQGAAKVLMSLSPSQAINDDIEFYVSILAYFIDVLVAFREEVMIYAPCTRSNWWSTCLDYHFTMAFSNNSLTEEQQAIALESIKLSWNDFTEKKKRCFLVKRPQESTTHSEMIARATVEHTTGHITEITNTQQVTVTQLEGVVHVDEDKAGECLIGHNTYNKGTNLLDEDGSTIRIGSNADLTIATERGSRPSVHPAESEENHDINMAELPYMVKDAVTQPHKHLMHGFLPMDEDGGRGIEKCSRLDIHPMPVQDIPQNITSAVTPASNCITPALNDQLSTNIPVDNTAFPCSIVHESPVDDGCSSSSVPHDTRSVVTGPVMAESSTVYGTSSAVVRDYSNREHEDADGLEYSRETDGSLGEIRPADTAKYAINNCIGDSSALSFRTTMANTMFSTPSRINSPWKDLSGDHVPPAIPQWINALKMVDRSPSHIKVLPGVGAGFRWPNPALFTRTESPVHQARALFRSTYWKEFLDSLSVEKQLRRFPPDSRIYSIMYRAGGIDEGEAREIREQALDAFKDDAPEAKHVFNWVDVQFNGCLAKTFEFHGLVFQLKDLLNIPLSIIPQVIWELCENNFADDVLWLDALFRRCHDSADVYSSLRSEEVYTLCGKQEVNTPMPLVRRSFGSERWNLRVKHVEGFQQLMSAWPKFPDHLKTPVPTENEYSFEETELNVFAFYAQTHFDYIGRIPVVPRRVPDMGPMWVYNVYRKNL